MQKTVDGVLLFSTSSGIEDTSNIVSANALALEVANFHYVRLYVVLHPGTDEAEVFPVGIEKPLSPTDVEAALAYEERNGVDYQK
ncbi:MAG: hypothetical protein GY822_16705 [Deltaproteobacteria bacterium]|nr:hypothetical protein [Deltaproteobacteria bacterium]